MAINLKSVSEKIFNLLKGYGFAAKAFDASGKQVLDPQEATRFAVADPNILVRVDGVENAVVFATNQNESSEDIRKALKEIADGFMLKFDFRLFNKTLKPKSENINIAQVQENDMSDVMEGFGTMTGSTKTSYQPLDNVKIVVKHKNAVNEESRGARSRNIHSIYIKRGDEKFRLPENNLKAARAMARHVYMGGEVFDNIGTAINEMAAEHRTLKHFVRYVQSANLVNEENSQYVDVAKQNLDYITNTLTKLAGVKTYADTVESVKANKEIEVLEDDLDLESQFTETHFDERVANAVSSIKNAMARRSAFEQKIDRAIQRETFHNLKNVIAESDALEFATPHAKLGYQVGQLSSQANNPTLSNYLSGISKKLSSGGSLSQHEYTTVKSCLLTTSEPRVRSDMAESIMESYENFIESFDIL